MVDPTAVLHALTAKGWMMATAESCTGGGIAAAITDIAGSSAVFDRGFVTYSNAAKMQMLEVPEALIEAHGAVSEQVAVAMANGALSHSDAQIAVAVTGIAGPADQITNPKARVCFGLAAQGHATFVETVEFGAIGRDTVRARTVSHALGLILTRATQP